MMETLNMASRPTDWETQELARIRAEAKLLRGEDFQDGREQGRDFALGLRAKEIKHVAICCRTIPREYAGEAETEILKAIRRATQNEIHLDDFEESAAFQWGFLEAIGDLWEEIEQGV